VQLPKLADNQINSFNPCLVGSGQWAVGSCRDFDKKPSSNLAPWAVGIRFEALNFARDLIAKEKDLVIDSFIGQLLTVPLGDMRLNCHDPSLGGAS
jgi:hypothetical protein